MPLQLCLTFDAFTCREALSVKQFAHVRIRGLPWASDSVGQQAAPDLGSIRSAHVGRLLCMRATVLRATAVQMLERQRTYACKKCKHRCAAVVTNCTSHSSGTSAMQNATAGVKS